jgi:hypothetical protein
MLKAKVEGVELALEKIIKSFTKFQYFAIESGGFPPDAALELSRTAMEIMNLSNEARAIQITGKEQGDSADSSDSTGSNVDKEKNDDIDEQVKQYVPMQASAMSKEASSAHPYSNFTVISKKSNFPSNWQAGNSISPQPSTTLFPWTSSHQNITFAQRLRLACVERGFQLLSTPNLSFPEIHPALSLHLKWMTIHELRALTEESLRGNVGQLNLYGPIQHPPVLIHPEMYRKVEGSKSVLVNRAPSKDVERLVFGRTRTIVETALPGFEGEWLEPSDVQEYLEGKGIQVGSPELTTVLPLIDLRPSNIDRLDSQFSVHAINLQSLIEYLALSAICIGPGPGMRRNDVDRALEHCIVEF